MEKNELEKIKEIYNTQIHTGNVAITLNAEMFSNLLKEAELKEVWKDRYIAENEKLLKTVKEIESVYEEDISHVQACRKMVKIASKALAE